MQENKNKQQFTYKQGRPRPKPTWMHRNPRLFSTIFITTGLSIFFSKPIYDFFIRDDIPDIAELRRQPKARFFHYGIGPASKE